MQNCLLDICAVKLTQQFSKEYLGPQPDFSITSGLRSARPHFGETLFSSVNTAVVILSLSYVFLYLCFKGLYVLL